MAFVSASEIVAELNRGHAHLGVTGEDLVRENIANAAERVTFLKPFGFGRADVVVAVPKCWIDVNEVADIAAAAMAFRRVHGRPFRVATKYVNLTRRFFSSRGLADYRIVESLGATEGTPAAGTADIIVDITTTGATLAANGLKVLEDGVILQVARPIWWRRRRRRGRRRRKRRASGCSHVSGFVCRRSVSRLRLHEGVDAHAGQQRHVAVELDRHLQHLDIRRAPRPARKDARGGHRWAPDP